MCLVGLADERLSLVCDQPYVSGSASVLRTFCRGNVRRGRLVESQLALVASIAQKYSASGVPMLDLIEEGNIGLMDAVRSFAEKPIGNFTAHAAACILQRF